MAASAAQVFTGVSGGRGDNSGRAAVLDSAPDFNSDVFYQRLYERQRQEKLDKAKAIKDQQKAWADLSLEMPDVWSVDSPYLEKQLLDYDDYITNMKMNGADPENLYTPEGKEVRRRAMEMEKTRALIGENEAFYNDLVKKVDNDKEGVFDKAHSTEFIRRYTDPKLSPQDRAKMRMEENPLKLNVTETDFINAALPEEVQQGRTTFRDPQAFEIMATDIVSRPNGQLMYESLKKEGEDQDAFVKRMRGQFEQMYKPSVRPAPQGSGGSGGSRGGSGTEKVDITFDYRDAEGLTRGVNKNIISVKRKGTQDDLPAIEVETGGELVNFQPIDFVLGQDGKIGVRGISETKGSMFDKPARKEMWVDYDTNRAKFEAQIGGDLYEFFRKQNQGGKGAAKQDNVVVISTKEEFDKLPSGTRFKRSDKGDVIFTKQ